jgi:hypothetical protein
VPSMDSPTPRKKPFALEIDLRADEWPYGDEPSMPRVDRDWRDFGTLRCNGVIAALAWKGGDMEWRSVWAYSRVPIWERIRLAAIMQFESLPRNELAPGFAIDMPRG